jgi:dipeptidyl aminopeptidase/acylaminoacyl peptidase
MGKILPLGLLIVLILLSGCGGTVPPGVVEESSHTSTLVASTATPTATVTHTPTPTVIPPTNPPTSTPLPPTSTPTATSTPRPQPPMPTPTPGLQGRFVFQVASGGDIYTANADGGNLTRVTTGMDPSWSPDGSRIALVRWTSPWGIYTMNANGSNERMLFGSNVARAPVWSPDGSQIAFYFETEGWALPEIVFPEGEHWYILPRRLETEWHLGVADVGDGYFHQPNCERYCFSPSWSADGQMMVYDGDQGLSVTTVEGPNNRTLTDNVHDQFPVWSPDGSRIAFMHWQHDHWEIYLMNANGSGRWPLTSSSPLLERRPNNVSPAWSPDGEQIVFLSDRGGKWEFYVMDADGSDQRHILENVTDGLDIQYNGANERVISWTR